MAQLIVRNIDEQVKAKLRRRAQRHGNSTEEEVRRILATAVEQEERSLPPLGSRLAARFRKIGLDHPIEELRGEAARPADLTS